MTRVVQLANFVTPTSGGLRTALDRLAQGYAATGLEVVQVVPGQRDARTEFAWGVRLHRRAPELPGTGYRVIADRSRLLHLLEQLAPDRVEVHDRTTMRGVGVWARRTGVPALVVSHERLDRWLRQWFSPRLPLDRVADAHNRALVGSFDAVVCTTAWAEQEFRRLDAATLHRVPLGVDLERFQPDRSDRAALLAGSEVLLVLASRLSREKRPDLAVGALRELQRRGVRARMLVAGHGPLEGSLRREAAGLPVELLGFVQDRARFARLLGAADAVLAPGPVETFGLAALEALACGTPVVANVHSALPEVVGAAGALSASTPRSFADAVQDLLARTDDVCGLARARAECYPWSASIEGFLRAHRLPVGPRVARLAA